MKEHEVKWIMPDGRIAEMDSGETWIPDKIEIQVPGGRYWEPGSEENPVLPEDQWIPDDMELPFE